MNTGRILVVEDESKVIYLVREVLVASGYEVTAVTNGELAVERTALDRPDLVILDIVLPGSLDGYGVARRIREFSNVPIIMLTGRVRETDLLHGFEAGADDYITKPFNAKELLVRIAAVLRRSRQGEGSKIEESEILCDHLHIDLARRQVKINGHEIHLTPTEYNLLHELATHPNQVLLHENLLMKVWGEEYRNDIDYLRTYIHTIRQKIEIDPAKPKIIQRCPGVGYSFVCNTKE
jgi:two-component system, OmpR family, KDP operon response regulator KdpE